MMPSAIPPGRQREQELAERLDEVQAEIDELHSALPSVNDPVLRTPAQALVEAADRVMTAHRGRLGSDIADDLAGLMSAAHTLRVPVQDPALGRTEALQTLRKAKGLIVTALGEALDAARALGLYPREAPFGQELPMEVPHTGNEGLLRGIAKRLDEVVRRLDALDDEKAVPTAFPQQTGLLNFYIGAMRVEVDLARLHLTVGEEAIDFGALARAVEVMTELTGDFVATVRAWIGRVSDVVTRIAEEVRIQVRRLVAGTSAAAKRIARGGRPQLAPYGVFAHQVGNRVLALWKSDDYWYPGTVTDVSEGRLLIKFEDGYSKWLLLDHVKSLEYSVNDYVECTWKGLHLYFPAHIIEIRGDVITVQYDADFSGNGPSIGEKEQTNIKFLRFSK
jgi:hypothetical protein